MSSTPTTSTSLTARYFPAWSPLSRRDRAKRIQLEQPTCRAARYVFAKTDFLRDALIEDYGCEPDRVVRVGSGSNIMVRSLDGKRYDGQAALFVGIDFERKGGPVLLRAWSAVRERLPDAELWVVGPKRRPAAAEQPGVRWHGFVSDRDELADLYARATLFVLPSLFEPWGGVLMEAQRPRAAVHRNRPRGLPGEHRRRGRTGCSFPPASPSRSRMRWCRCSATRSERRRWGATVTRRCSPSTPGTGWPTAWPRTSSGRRRSPSP